MSDHFNDAFGFIEEALTSGGKVLVHCFAGKSRSATICIAYLLKTSGMEYHAAFELVREARPIINPNPGFCIQLVKYYKHLHPERPAPGMPTEEGSQSGGGVVQGTDSADSLVALHAKAGSKASLLYRDDDMVVFHEKFGVCKNHLTIVGTKSVAGIKGLFREDIKALEAQHARGLEECRVRAAPIRSFQDVPHEDFGGVIVAGFFHPSTLEQLQLHMLMPPFRTERVCAHPKWHSFTKVIADLKSHGKVLAFDEHPDPEEGERTQAEAVSLHRRFKEMEKSIDQLEEAQGDPKEGTEGE